MSSVTSPSMRASSPKPSSIHTKLRQRSRQALKTCAISSCIPGFAIVTDGNLVHPRARRNHSRNFYDRGVGVAGILARLHAFDAFVEVHGGFIFFLVGDDALEEIWSRRSNRRRGIRYDGLRDRVSGESQRQQRHGNENTFAHDVKGLEIRQRQL